MNGSRPGDLNPCFFNWKARVLTRRQTNVLRIIKYLSNFTYVSDVSHMLVNIYICRE